MTFDVDLDYRATGVNILGIFASCKMIKVISETGAIDHYVEEIEEELHKIIENGTIDKEK